MTRSIVVFVLTSFISILVVCVPCGSQENDLLQIVVPLTSSTQNPVKITRKTSPSNRIPSLPDAWGAYYIATVSRARLNEATSSASFEYSNQLVERTTVDEPASAKNPSKSSETPTIGSPEPNKFAAVHPEQNAAFSETLYRERICKNEPTCDMAKLAPEELTNLGTRNCMCDEDCRKYGDCCLDSPYYNATEQRLNYQSFYCSAQELVYMVTSCPRNYFIEPIKSRCGYFDYESANRDLTLMMPVTSSKYKITFANAYCAACNGFESFTKWQVELKCDSLGAVEQSTTMSAISTTTSSIVIFPGANRKKKRIHQIRGKSVTTSPPQPETNAKEAAKYAQYDPKNKIFFSTYNGENFKCAYKRIPTDDLRSALRYCFPTVGRCSDFSNKTLVQLCDQSATTIVYNKIKHYKNPECALCNGVKDAEPLGCFDLGNRIGASSLFMAGGNKGPPNKTFCDKLSQRGQNKVCG